MRPTTETTSCTIPHPSREAAKECSPRRKPWEPSEREASPVGTKEPTANPCHPERSLAKREASGQPQSNDPYNLHGGLGDTRDFRIAIRFFDDHDTEIPHDPSREAAKACSPRRKPWEPSGREASPVGTAEPAANTCHPERSLAVSEASGQTQSKDPYQSVPPPTWRGVLFVAAGQCQHSQR